MGRYVIYSQEWPHTVHVAQGDVEGLVSALRDLQSRHRQGQLCLNLDGRDFTLDDSRPDARAAAMRVAILDVVGRRGIGSGD